jgi:hypothetical protein
LTAVAILMIVAFALSLVGILVDPRLINGAPAWLKPAKFAISTAIYSLTLAWIFTYLPDWPRLKSVTGWITAVVFVLEVAIIDVQADSNVCSSFELPEPVIEEMRTGARNTPARAAACNLTAISSWFGRTRFFTLKGASPTKVYVRCRSSVRHL